MLTGTQARGRERNCGKCRRYRETELGGGEMVWRGTNERVMGGERRERTTGVRVGEGGIRKRKRERCYLSSHPAF